MEKGGHKKKKNRAWVDIGGSNGYYAIALKLLGAKSVILLDIDLPCKWAVPVLNAVGVESLVGDGSKMPFSSIDSITLLYIESLELSNVFFNYPDLTQAVISGGFWDEEFGEIAEWTIHNVSYQRKFFIIGDGSAIPAEIELTPDDEIYWVEGRKIADPKQIQLELSARQRKLVEISR